MSKKRSLINVLLVSGGGFQGLAVLKGLLQAPHIRTVLADCYDENIGRYFAHHAHVVPPLSQRDRFLDELFQICKAEAIDIILPSTEMELPILAANAGKFARRGAHVAVSSVEFLRRVCDKKELQSFLVEEDLPAPEVIDIAATRLKYPVLGKPRRGWGGKGQIILRSAQDRRRHSPASLRQEYIWQPFYAEFVEYSADFAINLAGAISEMSVRERVRVSGGFAVISKSLDTEAVRVLAYRFAQASVRHGGRGLFNLQIMTAGGRSFISDVNPRMGTSATFGYGMGMNLPVFACSDTVAEKNEPRTKVVDQGARVTQQPVTMVRYLEELFVRDEQLAGIRGIVFDLDDTLISQKRWIMAKLRDMHAIHRQTLPDSKTFLLRAVEILEEGNRSKLIDALCADFGLGADKARELIATYRTCCPGDEIVHAEVWPLLDELKRRGYRLAILTNNPPASQRQKLKASGLLGQFSEIVYAAEMGAEKPARQGFLHVAKRLKLAPNELVMAGDNLYDDIGGALDSGYRHGFLVNRPGGFFNFDLGLFEELAGRGRKFTTISNLRDLLRHLGEAP